MRLHCTPGSSFSRMIRVLVRELNLDCEEAMIVGFPPAPEFFAINPLGQVPALETDGDVRFPTRIIIDYLLSLPTKGGSVRLSLAGPQERWRDEQTLDVILAMGDALGAIKYQAWAGLGPVGENLIGYDPATRHMERVSKALDWLDERATPSGFLPGFLSVQDIALSCVVLWTEARGRIPWQRPNLSAIVAACESRPIFQATQPQPWP